MNMTVDEVLDRLERSAWRTVGEDIPLEVLSQRYPRVVVKNELWPEEIFEAGVASSDGVFVHINVPFGIQLPVTHWRLLTEEESTVFFLVENQ